MARYRRRSRALAVAVGATSVVVGATPLPASADHGDGGAPGSMTDPDNTDQKLSQYR